MFSFTNKLLAYYIHIAHIYIYIYIYIYINTYINTKIIKSLLQRSVDNKAGLQCGFAAMNIYRSNKKD